MQLHTWDIELIKSVNALLCVTVSTGGGGAFSPRKKNDESKKAVYVCMYVCM